MLSLGDDDCKCSCRHPSSVLCAAWQGHLAQVFFKGDWEITAWWPPFKDTPSRYTRQFFCSSGPTGSML